MVDMWFIRCPRCGNYANKSDPQESAICRACGWEEYAGASFYCDIVNGFCTVIARDDK
jgi:hypothetical protein